MDFFGISAIGRKSRTLVTGVNNMQSCYYNQVIFILNMVVSSQHNVIYDRIGVRNLPLIMALDHVRNPLYRTLEPY